MKTLLKSLVILTVLAFSFAPSMVRAQDDSDSGDQNVSFQTFYDQLGDQGSWIQTDDYGYVFQPNVTDSDWQPYSDGSWVDSDAGFTWVSDEPWGWATYHYGRWANIEGIGWVWVPGYRWAPAWVSWRYGGGYCGWAPLPPETLYGAEYGEPGAQFGFGFHFGGDVDVNFHIGAGYYNFVRIGDMGERNYRHHIVNRSNNFAIINHTTNITNLNVTSGSNREPHHFRGIAAGGPPLNELNAQSRQHIQTVQLATTNQPGRSNLQGNTLSVFAPKVNPNSLHQGRPKAVAQDINHPTFNRGDSITKPLAVTRTVHAPAPTPEIIQAAEQAQSQAPATAKIVTPGTPMRTPPTHPFNSFAPVTHANPGNPVNPGNPGAGDFNRGNGNSNVEHHVTNPSGAVNVPGNQPNVDKTPTFHQQQQAPTFNQQEKPHTEIVNPTPTPAPAPTFHPNNQNNGGGQQPANTPPVHTFHSDNQNNGGNQQPANTPPVHTFHSENQNNGGGQQPANTPPVHTFHSENQNNGGGQQPANTAPVRTFHSDNQNNGGGQGGNQHPSVAPAPAVVHQSNPGGQGGNPPSGGNGKKDDKDKKP